MKVDGQEKEQVIKNREILRSFFKKYLNAQIEIEILKERLLEIQNNLNSPLSSPKFSFLPKTPKSGDKGAELVELKIEVEKEIENRIVSALKILTEIESLISILPPHSTERLALEMKFINGYPHEKIANKLYYSDRKSIEYHLNKGLDIIASNPEVDLKEIERR